MSWTLFVSVRYKSVVKIEQDAWLIKKMSTDTHASSRFSVGNKTG